MPQKIIIIGSGPAGLTAAIYTARAGLEPLVIAGFQAGGQLMLTTTVENYPGFPEGIDGPELMKLMRAQAERYRAKFIDDDVKTVDFSSRPFKMTTSDETYEGKAIIIATGASTRWLGLESEKKLIGRGVSSCATCDGFFFKNKEVIVVGGGDGAMEEALYLANLANKVTVIHRRDQLRASKIMQERAFKNPKIHFIWDSTVPEILGENRVEGVKINNVKTGKGTKFKCDGVFIAIGQVPNTKLFEGQIELDIKGYIVGNGSRTNIEGVFCAGDVFDYRYRQAVTAAGSGCEAAIDAERWLSEQE
ncbi:MAG: thioredoxin-disulfide reductase [Candidatus Heimdallarchaeota archaeon]